MVQLLGRINVVSLVILCLAIENKLATSAANEKSEYYVTNDYTRGLFGKLLKDIANVNEVKLQALMRLTAEDNYRVATGYLRDSKGQKGPDITVILKNNFNDRSPYKTNSKSRAYENTVFRNDQIQDNDYEDVGNIQNELLQDIEYQVAQKEADANSLQIPQTDIKYAVKEIKENVALANLVGELGPNLNAKNILRIWKSCSKKAAKKCKSACVAAYKDVCKEYKCSSSMKRDFKKTCKSECKSQFND